VLTPLDAKRKTSFAATTRPNVKTRTPLLIAFVGTGAFVTAEIDRCGEPTQTSSAAAIQVVQYADPQAGVKAEPTLPNDPVAKQRAVDAELDKAIRRAIDIEVNRAS
jgi:hypothetical protein